MYSAKRAGKGRYAVYEEGMRGACSRVLISKLSCDARWTSTNSSSTISPCWRWPTSRSSASRRWCAGSIPPRAAGAGEFIALAEETGLIVPLGRWVLRQACEDVARWQQTRSDERPLQLSVNLSSRQLQDPDLAADVTAALRETRLAPGSLVLEITESMLMRDTALNSTLLQDLRHRGALLAIDDFGTGYSSLAYLLAFPIDILKIDRVFIEHAATNASSFALTAGDCEPGPQPRLARGGRRHRAPRPGRAVAETALRRGPGLLFCAATRRGQVGPELWTTPARIGRFLAATGSAMPNSARGRQCNVHLP